MKKIKIGLDWDDVVAPFNSIACEMANEEFADRFKNDPLTINDITSWENEGRANVIHKYYEDKRLYDRQTAAITEDAINAVHKLEEIADIYFITAVYPDFMPTRARQIQTIFPELGIERMIFGQAKELVQFDMILDDNICNVLNSKASFPVLMRKPWNRNMTGLLSVNNMSEFVSLVKHILHQEEKKDAGGPQVIALVGPSGSRKTDIADNLISNLYGMKLSGSYVRARSYSTDPFARAYQHTILSQEEFDKEDFFEKTSYAGYSYGTKYEDIKKCLDAGDNVVMPLDMCGAIAMKAVFPTKIVYVKRPKDKLVQDIITSERSVEEKTIRILSIEAEKKNEAICDMTVCVDGDLLSPVHEIDRMVSRET